MSYLDKELLGIKLNSTGSHFFHLYKNEGRIKDYKERMKTNVETTRLKERQLNFDLNRALNSSDDEVKAINNCFYKKNFRSKNKWSNLMMLAEWFMLVPDAFYDNYCMKFCPFGKHVLLVSQKKTTMIFNKNGSLITSFKSSLPGGGMNNSANCSAIFDCIYDQENKIIYFLDIIYYMRQDFRDMTAENRFSWLDNYLKQEMSSSIQASGNITFDVLSAFDCSRNNLVNVFQDKIPFPLDGLLFYSKHGVYVSGSTYSSMWLKPYMVPELLDMDVHEDYMANMPMDYATYRDDIIKYNAQYGWQENRQSADKIDDKKEMDLN